MRSEQKKVAWVKNILQKLTRSRNLVEDCYARTLSISKPYLFLQKRRTIKYRVDPSCAAQEIPQLILIYGRKLSIKELDTYSD